MRKAKEGNLVRRRGREIAKRARKRKLSYKGKKPKNWEKSVCWVPGESRRSGETHQREGMEIASHGKGLGGLRRECNWRRVRLGGATEKLFLSESSVRRGENLTSPEESSARGLPGKEDGQHACS